MGTNLKQVDSDCVCRCCAGSHGLSEACFSCQREMDIYAGSTQTQKVHELCQQFIIPFEKLEEISQLMLNEIKKGLAKKTHPTANIKCFVTYVQDLPTGNERGKFLALDLGGTNFRVLLINLTGTPDFQMDFRTYALPKHVMVGTGTQLFDHIAECLANFMKELKVENEPLSLGFTFSFPLVQSGLSKGTLVTWTNGFNCSGVVNEDVVQLLKDAIDRRGDVKIDVCAILNDTTGTLMSCAWKNHNCKIGLIVGTGCNACYVERIEEAEMFDGSSNGKPHVIINLEWGDFGENGCLDFIQTEFDKEVDQYSPNCGQHVFEKMISGMYMGELVRLILVKLNKDGVLFQGQKTHALMIRHQFHSKHVSDIAKDKPGVYKACHRMFSEFGLTGSDETCENIRYICECISMRSAHLVSTGLATLLNKINEPFVIVGIDGSVCRYHKNYKKLMMEKMQHLVKPRIKFELMLSEDGSGRGAALVAAVTACQIY